MKNLLRRFLGIDRDLHRIEYAAYKNHISNLKHLFRLAHETGFMFYKGDLLKISEMETDRIVSLLKMDTRRWGDPGAVFSEILRETLKAELERRHGYPNPSDPAPTSDPGDRDKDRTVFRLRGDNYSPVFRSQRSALKYRNAFAPGVWIDEVDLRD